MAKIGIIRCQETALKPDNHRCPGWNCFPAIANKTGYLDEYDTIELVGFDTCSGCPGRNNTQKIVDIGLELKKHGAEVIHLSTCLAFACPNKDMFVEALNEHVGLPVKENTHGGPDGKRVPIGPDRKPILPKLPPKPSD